MLGDTMPNENQRTKIALFLVMLMILTPLASGASIDNFSSGSDEVDVLLNDASTYSNNVDGSIDLPVGESITGASMAVSSDPAIHGAHTRIDIETMPRVWNPNFNGQKTSFSAVEEFQFEDGSTSTPVSLKAEGILTDFEGDMAGFMDGTPPPLQSGVPWEHGSLFGGWWYQRTALLAAIAGVQGFMTMITPTTTMVLHSKKCCFHQHSTSPLVRR